MISEHDSIIVRICVRIMIPFLQLYALYVLMHGHYSAGGGFQAGTMLGASVILKRLAYGSHFPGRQLGEQGAIILGAVGVALFAGIGVLSVLKGGAFLDYAALPLPGLGDNIRRSYGILGIEIGVCAAVMAILVSIFYSLVVPEEDAP